MRRPDTGDRGLALLARLAPDAAPRDTLRALFTRHDGNGARVAAELGLASAQPLMATVEAMGLSEWLQELRRGVRQ